MDQMSDLAVLRGAGLADKFFNGGLQFIKPKRRRGGRKPLQGLNVRNDCSVLAFIKKEFPKMATDAKHLCQATLWHWVIYYYFREGWSAEATRQLIGNDGLALRNHRGRLYSLQKHKVTVQRRGRRVPGRRTILHEIVKKIRRRALGLRRDGKPMGRGRGRPRSLELPLQGR
jgi:hypothetical protein